MTHWILCYGSGYLFQNGDMDRYKSNFEKNSVGLIKGCFDDENYLVWLIGTNSEWIIHKSETKDLNVFETGDKYHNKICNICHCLKSVDHFAPNQNNLHGVVRRPSCKKCRTDIDKRSPKSQQAEEMKKRKPKKGEPFKCPICKKRSIVGITAKIVADHDRHTGNLRDYICDSCNTGLGRFKNGENYLMNAVNYIKERDKLAH